MTRERVIRVPTPVVQPVDPRLTADCVPATSVPAEGALTVRDALERLDAVEFALAGCRSQIEQIRKAQP